MNIHELLTELRLTAIGASFPTGEGHCWRSVKIRCDFCELWLSYREYYSGLPDLFLTTRRPDSTFSGQDYVKFCVFMSRRLHTQYMIARFNTWQADNLDLAVLTNLFDTYNADNHVVWRI